MKKQVVGSMSEWSGMLIDWQNFYREVFGIEVDLSNIEIPKKKKGFSRPIIVILEITPQKLYDKCKELFPCWKGTNRSLDKVIDPEKSERKAENGPYLIWVRDRVEADRELKNLSAIQIQEKRINTETFEERVLHELKFFKETGKHLDIGNVTLCSGSRYSGGYVPLVDWSRLHGRLSVRWYYSGLALGFLRAREVVS